MTTTLAFYAIIIIVFYLVLLLPQQRRQKEAKALLAAIKVGDEVVLSSGIHGFVSELEADVAWVEVAPNVDLKVSRSSISARINAQTASESES
jgi:preprotein translocase subunit YajC